MMTGWICPVLRLLFLAIFTSILLAQSPSGWVEGHILDTAGSPIQGVQVYVIDSDVGGLTDSSGYFQIGPLQPGSYEIVARYIGYKDIHITGIEVLPTTAPLVNLVMTVEVLSLGEVVVMPKQHDITAEGVAALLTRQMIEESPGAAQDIFLVLQTLPGISSTGDDSKLYVRGGRPEENLAMLPNDKMGPLFKATIQATEEAILNALTAAETMEGAGGNTIYAMPHDRVKKILKKFNRLEKYGE